MFLTGHEALDADHAQISAFWVEFRQRLAKGDRQGAAEICQQGMRFCLDHWIREEAMLIRTDWPQPIIRCHIDDHERLERCMVGTLTLLNGDGAIEQADIEAFESDLVIHMATFDLSLVERLRRGTDRHPRRQPS